MDSKEEKRRSMQRSMQEFVLKLQKEGKSKEEIAELKKKRKRELKNQGGGGSSSGRSWRQRNFQDKRDAKRGRYERPRGPDYSQYATREEADKARKRDEMAKKHDLVIIPIYWKKREDEAQAVLDCAQDLKNKLMKHRVNTWIDQRTSLAPGQKYEYWESLGVKFRLELGPQEVSTETVCLSKANLHTDEPASRWKDMSTKIEDFHKILEILRDEGLKWVPADANPCEACAALREEEKNPSEKPRAPVVKKSFTQQDRTTAAQPQGRHVQFSDDEDSGDDNAGEKTETNGDSLDENYLL